MKLLIVDDMIYSDLNNNNNVWIGTEQRASIPVPEQYRSTGTHYKLSGTYCLYRNEPHKILCLRSEWNGAE